MEEVEIGRISHYFSKIQVGVARITGDRLKVGDVVHIKGHSSDFFRKLNQCKLSTSRLRKPGPGKKWLSRLICQSGKTT